MKPFGYDPRLGFAHYLRQSILRRLLHPLYALELLHELFRRRLADPLDSVELTPNLTLGATVAMVGDAEAVGLVAQMLHDLQTPALLVDIERQLVAREIDLLKTLGDAHESHLPLIPISSNASTAALSWPLPPSTTTSWGNSSPSATMRE